MFTPKYISQHLYLTRTQRLARFMERPFDLRWKHVIYTIIAFTLLVGIPAMLYAHSNDPVMTSTVSQWDVKGNLQSSNIGKMIQGK